VVGFLNWRRNRVRFITRLVKDLSCFGQAVSP